MFIRILEMIRKYLWLGTAVFIVCALVIFVNQQRNIAVYKVEKEQFKKELKQKESDIKNLNDVQLSWMNAATTEKANAEKQARANKELQEQLIKTNIENEQQKRLIEKMVADEVVAETRKKLALSETDIWKNGFGVQFTLVGAKKNLLRLADADYFSLVREPKLLEIINGKDKEISGLRKTIFNYEKALTTCDEVKSNYEKIQIDYANILKKSEKQTGLLRLSYGITITAVIVTALYILLRK
jgi:hypothetical protein